MLSSFTSPGKDIEPADERGDRRVANGDRDLVGLVDRPGDVIV